MQGDFKGLLERANTFEAQIDARNSQNAGQTGASVVKNDTKQQDEEWDAQDGKQAIKSHLSGLVIKIWVKEGELVEAGHELAVIEAMKMEHAVRSTTAGVVHKIVVKEGGVVNASDIVLVLDTSSTTSSNASSADDAAVSAIAVKEDPNIARPELEELQQRRYATLTIYATPRSRNATLKAIEAYARTSRFLSTLPPP